MFYEVLGDEVVTPERKAAVEDILQENKDNENIIVTSVMTHMEIIPSKLELKKPGAERRYMGMFDGKHFLDVEVGRNILTVAREIREFYYRPPDVAAGKPPKLMDTVDSIHLATAIIYRAAEFHTRDDDHKGTKIPLVSLYTWSGVDKVCGKYPLIILSPETVQKVLPLGQGGKGKA